MRKNLIVGICVCVLVAFSALVVYAQGANNDGDQSVVSKIDSLNKDITAINQKLDQILENQTKTAEEIKTIKVLIRRM
jgi:hypothetical protein